MMKVMWRWLVRLGIFGVIIWGGRSRAQLPGTIDPGRIPGQVEPPTLPTPDIDIEIPAKPDLQPPPDADAIKFRLRGLEVVGVTALHDDELAVTYETDIDTDISLARIYEIANSIQDLYIKKGYFLTRVFVPEQRIREGVVRIEVVEGYIEEVQFTENSHPRLQKRLEGYIRRILRERPAKLQTLERSLLLMNDLAGFTVSSAINPGKQRGAAVLTLNVTLKTFSPYFDFNNWADERVGPIRAQTGLIINSPFKYGERLTVGAATALPQPEELVNAIVQASVPIGSDGWKVEGAATYSQTKPGADLKDFKITGRSFNFNIGATYPVIRSRNTNLTFGIKFDLTNSTTETKFLGPAIVLSQDRVRNIRASVSYQASGLLGITGISVELSQGLGLFDATFGDGKTPISRVNGDPTAFKALFNATQVFVLPNNINLSLSLAGQIASNSLLSSEQFGVGGPNFGSAYNFSQITGDSGWSGRIELERTWLTQIGQTPIFLRPYIYADYGQTFLIKPLPVEKPSQELASAGLGVRYNISNFLQGRFELAFPFQEIKGISNPRFLFSLQGVF